MLIIKSVEMDDRGHMLKVEFGEGCLSGEVADFLKAYGLYKLNTIPDTLPEQEYVDNLANKVVEVLSKEQLKEHVGYDATR